MLMLRSIRQIIVNKRSADRSASLDLCGCHKMYEVEAPFEKFCRDNCMDASVRRFNCFLLLWCSAAPLAVLQQVSILTSGLTKATDAAEPQCML